jgi:hypothetical protein
MEDARASYPRLAVGSSAVRKPMARMLRKFAAITIGFASKPHGGTPETRLQDSRRACFVIGTAGGCMFRMK